MAQAHFLKHHWGNRTCISFRVTTDLRWAPFVHYFRTPEENAIAPKTIQGHVNDAHIPHASADSSAQ